MNVYTAAVILIVVFAAVSGVQAFILQPIDVSGAPPEIQYIYHGLLYVFSTSAIAPLFVALRNLLGYAENYFQADPTARKQMKFEAGQLQATWVKYEAYINAAAIFIVAVTAGTQLAPFAFYMAGTAAFIIDLIRKAFKDAGATSTPTIFPAAPVPPQTSVPQ